MSSFGVSCYTPCRTAFIASAITVFSVIVIAPRNSPFAGGCSQLARPCRLTMLTSLDRPRTASSTLVLAAAGAWRGSARFRDRAQSIPRHGTTAHEPRGLVLMVNTLVIFAAGAAERPGVACHAAPAASPSPHKVRSLGVTFVNGALARQSPVTALLLVCLRAVFSLPTPAFYSP